MSDIKECRLGYYSNLELKANELATLNAALGKSYDSKEMAIEAMLADKTGAALAIFESNTTITMPAYLSDVIGSV